MQHYELTDKLKKAKSQQERQEILKQFYMQSGESEEIIEIRIKMDSLLQKIKEKTDNPFCREVSDIIEIFDEVEELEKKIKTLKENELKDGTQEETFPNADTHIELEEINFAKDDFSKTIFDKIEKIEKQIKEEEFKFETAVFYRHKNIYEQSCDKILNLENEKKHLMEELKGYIDFEEDTGIEEPMSLFEGQTPYFNLVDDTEESKIMTNKLSTDIKRNILKALASENAEGLCKIADQLDERGHMEAADVISIVAEYKIQKAKADKKHVAKVLREMKKEAFDLAPDAKQQMIDKMIQGVESSTSMTAQQLVNLNLTYDELKYIFALSKNTKNPDRTIAGYLDMIGKAIS